MICLCPDCGEMFNKIERLCGGSNYRDRYVYTKYTCSCGSAFKAKRVFTGSNYRERSSHIELSRYQMVCVFNRGAKLWWYLVG